MPISATIRVKARFSSIEDLNRPEEAIAACSKALTYDPNLAFAHTYKGRILASQERDQEALVEFDQVLMIDSTSTDALFYKAGSLLILQRFDETAIIGDRLISLDPTPPQGGVSRHWHFTSAREPISRPYEQ